MFERRLKIFLGILLAITGVLLLRAVNLQVFRRDYWQERAAQTMKRSHLVETVRGRILDCRGREMAVDLPCIDACVDYRAIKPEPDEAWLRDEADQRLRARLGATYTSANRERRREMAEEEITLVKSDLAVMWSTLAQRLSEQTGKTTLECLDEINSKRESIVKRVEMRRRYLWYHNYEAAVKRFENREPSPWYRQWLIDDSKDAPQLEQFDVVVAEQTESHVILPAIDAQTSTLLGKNIEHYPGLELRPSTHRAYPYGSAACHLLGQLSQVNRDDLLNDPSLGKDELRQYYPGDLIGRTGLESLGEAALRGARGRIERVLGEDDKILDQQDPVHGGDVVSTIDVELQSQIEHIFQHRQEKRADGSMEDHELYGAAVVIDVSRMRKGGGGEVRALVSYPTYDPNQLDETYSKLVADEINRPLFNRATMAQFEPGSTMKPLIGLGAITSGILKSDETIECTGYLVLHGRTYHDVGRCWVAKKFFEKLGGDVAHHKVPYNDPHPTGFLTYSDALERSCNVFFETVGDRMGADLESEWMSKFGLGRPTGIGIAETSGRLPNGLSAKAPSWVKQNTKWFAAIGQGHVGATPLQMANVAATISRDGVWQRPTLIASDSVPASDRVNLHLAPDALAAAKLGMVNVVNKIAGTGYIYGIRRDDVKIAGKTGTAQASPFNVPMRDVAGKLILDEHGRPRRRFIELSTPDHRNPEAPWYRGSGTENKEYAHAWVIGFAPAENPQIAFCVMVEYGGSGGAAAGPLVKDLLEACVEHDYLSVNPKP